MAFTKAGPGRPKGSRNKASLPLKEYAQQYTMEAIDVAVEVMRDRKAAKAARIAAVALVLDRGHGKPEAKSEVTIIRNAQEMSREQLLAIAARGGAGTAEADGRGREPDRVH